MRTGNPGNAPVSAAATRAATRALFSARARFAGTLAPAVCRSILSSTNGVTAAPVICAAAQAASAASSAAFSGPGASSSAGGIGTVSSTPVDSRVRPRSTSATTRALSTRCGTGSPLERR